MIHDHARSTEGAEMEGVRLPEEQAARQRAGGATSHTNLAARQRVDGATSHANLAARRQVGGATSHTNLAARQRAGGVTSHTNLAAKQRAGGATSHAIRAARQQVSMVVKNGRHDVEGPARAQQDSGKLGTRSYAEALINGKPKENGGKTQNTVQSHDRQVEKVESKVEYRCPIKWCGQVVGDRLKGHMYRFHLPACTV